MSDNLNAVKTSSSRDARYHHGALREALIAAAEAELAEHGVERFSLRATARRAGVSPAAPAHHFGDARGLLTAVATAAFVDFGLALAAADDAAPRATDTRLRAQGIAYVNFALAQPARFELMWRKGLLNAGDPDLAAAGGAAFAILQRAVGGSDCGAHGASDQIPSAAAIACWAIVHGFARLALDGSFGTGPEAAQAATNALLPAVLGHLSL